MKIGNRRILVCAVLVLCVPWVAVLATNLAVTLKRQKNLNILRHINSTVGSSEKLKHNLWYFDVGFSADKMRSAQDVEEHAWLRDSSQHKVRKGDEVVSFYIIDPNASSADNLSYLMGFCRLKFGVVYRNNQFVFAQRTPIWTGM